MGPSSVFLQSPPGVGTALLLIIVTIFLGLAAKGRSVARRALDHKETNLGSLEERESSIPDLEETNRGYSSLEETEPGADVGVPNIFLSHSGIEFFFVECLCDALEKADYTVFFDQHTLSKGSPFPSRIEEAARGCKIGVVVLSEEFFASKRSMKELEMLVLQRGPKRCVLPLFYKLQPADLKSPEKLLKWRCVWKKMGDESGAKLWEQVVKALEHFNGEVYRQGTNIDVYIQKVVQRICHMMPSYVPYDCSSIQGQSRLVQEIRTKFEQLDTSQACMVGLHGVGGLGKTTLCKAMVNYYSSRYCGRSFLIEFPSPCGELSTIVLQCKEVLNKLTGASYEQVLNEAKSFGQVVQLMRDCVGRHDVFLAIDNVWEGFMEVAHRVLRVGFSANSKILVTSRSEEVLKGLIMVRGHINKASVAPLPALEREEAFRIFQETFESYDLSALVDSDQMEKVLARCRFSGRYHALALKALAKYVKRVCMTAGSEGIEHVLSCALEEIRYQDLSVVEDVIRLSYDNLPEQKKHMFLDIVVCFNEYWSVTSEEAQEWIGFLYYKFPRTRIFRLINELLLDGLIQIEVDKHGTQKIRFHGLYLELALREIASSPRHLINNTTESAEKIDWEKLELVILNGDGLGPRLFEKLQQCKKCPKLKLLKVLDIEIKSGIWLNSMPSLRLLSLLENERGNATTDSEKENVARSHLLQPGMSSLGQEGTIKNSRGSFVTGEVVVDASHILHLNGLVELQKLEVVGCSLIEGIAGLDALGKLKRVKVRSCKRLKSLDGLSGLINLEALCVSSCRSLQKLLDVSSLTRLERLELVGNEAMEEVGGLSRTLKDVSVGGCRVLKRMPDMSSLTCLERLELVGNEAMEEVGGLSCTLKDVSVRECWVLKRMPDVSSLTCLERLKLVGNEAMEEVGGLSRTLKGVSVRGCRVLKRMPDMSSLTRLERLRLVDNEAMEEVGGLSCTLKDVRVEGCRVLKRMPDVSGLTRLERLELAGNEAMEEVGGEYLRSTLKHLDITDCRSLRSCPSLDKCMHMETLKTGCAHYISSLQKLPNLHTCLQHLTINECGWWSTIKKIDVGCLTNLKELAVLGCGALEEIGGLRALCSLKNLTISKCPSLKKLNVGCASLKVLKVLRCKALEEIIGDLKALPGLEDLTIGDCRSLKRLEGISSTPLLRLDLRRCESLQESSIPEAILPRPGEGHSYIRL